MALPSIDDQPLALDTVIIIPAFNESDSIGAVIEEIRSSCEYPILVVDDTSSDDTIEEARRAGASIIPLAAQLGAWGATQTGLRYALRHGYQYAITMDADGQHTSSSIQHLVDPVARGNCDVSIGACTRRGSMMRRIAWRMMKQTSGLRLEDITSGFRVYNRTSMIHLASWQATLLDYQDIGVLLMLQSKRLKIYDVEVEMRDRSSGKSKVFSSWSTVVYYMCCTLLLGFSKRRVASHYLKPGMGR